MQKRRSKTCLQRMCGCWQAKRPAVCMLCMMYGALAAQCSCATCASRQEYTILILMILSKHTSTPRPPPAHRMRTHGCRSCNRRRSQRRPAWAPCSTTRTLPSPPMSTWRAASSRAHTPWPSTCGGLPPRSRHAPRSPPTLSLASRQGCRPLVTDSSPRARPARCPTRRPHPRPRPHRRPQGRTRAGFLLHPRRSPPPWRLGWRCHRHGDHAWLDS